MINPRYTTALAILTVIAAVPPAFTQQPAAEPVDLSPGKVLSFTFPRLPKTLHELNTGQHIPATFTVRLPDNYDAHRQFPLLLFLRGGDGTDAKSMEWVPQITGGKDYIVAVFPLFKIHMLDQSLPGRGLLVVREDYPVIAPSYKAMLTRLDKTIPNIRREGSTLAGFSNGGHTIALLVDQGDEEVLSRFDNFALIDGGFGIWGISRLKDKRLLLMMGDDSSGSVGRLRDSTAARLTTIAREVGLALDVIRMPHTGHAFGPEHFPLLYNWMHGKKDTTDERR